MSTSLETIIRPFQTGSTAPPQRYVNASATGVPNVFLRIGRGGVGKTMNGNFSYSKSTYGVSQVQEQTET
jgi:hypothetical protein